MPKAHLDISMFATRARWFASLVVSATALGCDDNPLGLSGWIDARRAEQRWSERRFSDYQFDFLDQCFFCFPGWRQIHVRADTVAAVFTVEGDSLVPQERYDYEYRYRPTIEWMFDIITSGHGPYAEIDARYDPVLGFPQSVVFTAARGVTDVGGRWEVRNVRPLQPTVTVTNQASSGSGAVIVGASGGTSNVTNTSVTGGQDGGGGAQIGAGESRTFTVSGTMTGSSGTVNVSLTYSHDGEVVTTTTEVDLNKPVSVRPGQGQPGQIQPKDH